MKHDPHRSTEEDGVSKPWRDMQEGDGWRMYLGDCREIAAMISANALVTDPPYGIGWTRGTWSDDEDQYPSLMRFVVETGTRIGGWSFVFQAMLNCHKWHEWFPSGWRIFAACKNFAQVRPTGVWHSWDPVVFWNSGPNSGPNSGHVNRDYHVGNVAGVFGSKINHPCPRPLDTMRHIVQLAAGSGDVVLDPFAGSGTTGVSCIETGRRFVGIEIDENYFRIACNRLRSATPCLFGAKT